MLSDIESLKRQNTLILKCVPTALFFFHACQFNIKNRHKTPKPCKKELRAKWWLVENISLVHLGLLVAYRLNYRILTVWELKQEIFAHLATTGSEKHAKRWLTAQFCFVSVYSIFVMKPTVLSHIAHIFFDCVTYKFFYNFFNDKF